VRLFAECRITSRRLGEVAFHKTIQRDDFDFPKTVSGNKRHFAKPLVIGWRLFLFFIFFVYHLQIYAKKSEQTLFLEKYCFGVNPLNDLKSLIKCDWSKYPLS
jgi:hypothetical protein